MIGAADAEPPTLAAARAVGRALALAEAILISGGLGGVMEAASEGAAEHGGLVVGILPGEDPRDANAGVSVPIPTGMGQGRNVLVARASEAVVALAGAWGTRSEAALCMKLGVPLVGVMDTLGAEFPIERCREPDAAVARALELANEARREARG